MSKADGGAQIADLVDDLRCEHSLNDWVLIHLLLHHSALLAFVEIYLQEVTQISFKWEFFQSFSCLFFGLVLNDANTSRFNLVVNDLCLQSD